MQWDVEPVATQMAQMADDLTARINALDPESDTPVYSDFNFSIAVGDWTLANGVYTARINNTVLLTENSGIQVFYDASLRNYLVGDIFADKYTGYVIFTTTHEPLGTISGAIRVLDSVSGMLSIAKGGTGASTPKTARANLDVPIRDIPVSFGTVSSLPQTIYDADITEDMVAFGAVFGNPAAIPGGIDVTFAAGSVTITGTLVTGAETSIQFWCHEKRSAVEGTETSPAEPRINEFVHVGAQTLTAAQQTQIRQNLGAASASDFEGVEIPANTDLDTLVTPGRYYTANATRTNSLTNCPITGTGFTLDVQKKAGNAVQILYSGSTIYTRAKFSAGWDTWVSFAVHTPNTRLTITRTENSFCNDTQLQRCRVYRKDGMYSIIINLQTSAQNATSDYVEIGRISDYSAYFDVYVSIPAQDVNDKNIVISISPTGIIKLFAGSGTGSTFYRSNMSVPVDD